MDETDDPEPLRFLDVEGLNAEEIAEIEDLLFSDKESPSVQLPFKTIKLPTNKRPYRKCLEEERIRAENRSRTLMGDAKHRSSVPGMPPYVPQGGQYCDPFYRPPMYYPMKPYYNDNPAANCRRNWRPEEAYRNCVEPQAPVTQGYIPMMQTPYGYQPYVPYLYNVPYSPVYYFPTAMPPPSPESVTKLGNEEAHADPAYYEAFASNGDGEKTPEKESIGNSETSEPNDASAIEVIIDDGGEEVNNEANNTIENMKVSEASGDNKNVELTV